jgi:hypothetical protein
VSELSILCPAANLDALAPLRREEGIMSDNPLEPGPQDYDRVNVLVESELDYWARELGIGRAQLAAAIEAVGPGVNEIREYLAACASARM